VRGIAKIYYSLDKSVLSSDASLTAWCTEPLKFLAKPDGWLHEAIGQSCVTRSINNLLVPICIVTRPRLVDCFEG
jgi:hypothetical protein